MHEYIKDGDDQQKIHWRKLQEGKVSILLPRDCSSVVTPK